MKIKKGDLVKIITGANKNKIGNVICVMPRHSKVVIEGINPVTRRNKNSSKQNRGELITKYLPIHVSNVMYCHEDKVFGRIGYKLADSVKTRYLKKHNITIVEKKGGIQ